MSEVGNEISVGIAGCGKIAAVSHVPGLQAVPGVRVTALCDADVARAEALRESAAPDAVVCADFDALLASRPDAVAVCTPNNLHHAMATAAMESGAHVLCEKPLAGTLCEADELVSAAARTGRVLHVNQSLRYLPAYVTIARLVAEGRIGEPIHARCLRAGGRSPDKGWSPGATWFVSRDSQGGVILDIAVHMADLLKWVMGDVESVAAFVDTRIPGIDVPDNVSALFRFAGGGTGVLELSWSMPAGGGYLEIYGTGGRLRSGFTEEPLELTTMEGEKAVTTFPGLVAPERDSFASFIAAIRGEADSPTPGSLGRDAVALCEAIAESGERGEFVRVR